MLRIAVCDDDPVFVLQIRDLLLRASMKFDFQFELLSFLKGKDLLNAPPDYNILFLDIMLEDDMDGIELGQTLRSMGNQALFVITTSLTNRHRDGYKASVHRYLEKPFATEEFDEAIVSAIYQIFHSPQKLTIQFKSQVSVINISDIIYIESFNRKRYINTEHEKHLTLETISELQARLPKRFYSPQKSYLINFEHVIGANKSFLTLKGGHTIHFVKKGYADFNLAFMTYLGGVQND